MNWRDFNSVSQLFGYVADTLRRGDPVPVDLHARLVEAGYDVAQMERTSN